jgi:hypothetical protein
MRGMVRPSEPALPHPPPASDTLRVHNRRSYLLGHAASVLVVAAVAIVWWPKAVGANALAIAIFVLLFGPVSLSGLRQALRPGPRLVLGPDGVAAADLGVGTIPWSAIGDVRPFSSEGTPFVTFRILEAAPWLARMPVWPRFVARLQALLRMPYFTVNLIGVDHDPAAIVRCAQAWLARAQGS